MAKHAASDRSDEQRSGGRGALEWVVVIAIALGVALLLRTFVVETYIVPSGSMLDTIHEGDTLVGEKITYRTSSPQAGDVVTFKDPEDQGTTLIKRVIATEGQTVDLVDGTVYVDGQPLDESYTEGRPSEPLMVHSSTTDAITYPYTVPSGCIWVMGDNRTNSLDSRYFGAIPVSSVTSHALFIFWPFSDARGL